MPTCINCGKEIIDQTQLQKEESLCASCAEKRQEQQNQETTQQTTNIMFWSLIGGGMVVAIGIVLRILEIVDSQVAIIIIVFGLVDVLFNGFFYWLSKRRGKKKNEQELLREETNEAE